MYLNILVLYLNTGKLPKSDNFLKYSSATETKEFASKLYSRLFPEDEDNYSDDDEDVTINESEDLLDILIIKKKNANKYFNRFYIFR